MILKTNRPIRCVLALRPIFDRLVKSSKSYPGIGLHPNFDPTLERPCKINAHVQAIRFNQPLKNSLALIFFSWIFTDKWSYRELFVLLLPSSEMIITCIIELLIHFWINFESGLKCTSLYKNLLWYWRGMMYTFFDSVP